MSALAGLWRFDASPGAGADCERMLAAQQIYGPHDGASWDGGEIAIGRRLFRTLPEDRWDRGPVEGGGGRFRLVADVRLDNRDELGEALGIEASPAATLPDAAYLMHAWERWGENCFDKLLGDYAFVLWDEAERRLILARDALGMRPLHYHRGAGFFAFSSMPKGLHALSEIPYAPDEARAAEFLALIPESGPRSFFDGIERVEGGCFVVVDPAGVKSARHWDPRPETIAPWTGGDPAEAFRAHLDRAVSVRLRGAGPRVGAHLSGGLDSSAVATTAAQLLAPTGGTVVAFTSVPREGYAGPDPQNRFGDEGPLAAASAALHTNIEHVLVRPESGLLDGVDRDFFLYERPLLNLCNNRWIADINTAARDRGLGVLLTGMMGNMSISYGGTELLHDFAARGRWLRLFREGRALVAGGEMSARGVLATALGPWIPAGFWRAYKRIRHKANAGLAAYSAVKPARAAALGLEDIARTRGLDFSYKPRGDAFETRLWVLRRVDTGDFYKGWLGGWGLDVRDPTTDRRLIEFSLSLPADAHLSNGRTRALIRRALTDRLPAAVLDEQRKGLQAIDWHEDMVAARAEIADELDRLEQVPAAVEALDLARMRGLVEQPPEGGWHREEIVQAYRLALLRGYATGRFLRKASRSNA